MFSVVTEFSTFLFLLRDAAWHGTDILSLCFRIPLICSDHIIPTWFHYSCRVLVVSHSRMQSQNLLIELKGAPSNVTAPDYTESSCTPGLTL